MRQRLLFAFLIALLWPLPARALDPTKRITQYAHASWRGQDGAFTSVPYTIEQTPDGYIWIGTSEGIFRFDGVRFVRWTPGQGQTLPSSLVIGLRTTRDGSVWISALGVLSRWKNHTLTTYAREPNTLYFVAEDPQGTVWVLRREIYGGTGPLLCQALDVGLRCLDSAGALPPFFARGLVADREGTLWVAGDTGLLRWAQGKSTIYRPDGVTLIPGLSGVSAVAASPDGTLWVGFSKAAPGEGLTRLVNGRLLSFDTPALRGSSLNVSSLHVDRHGALWVGTSYGGIYRIVGDVVDHFDHTNGLSSDAASDVTEDREGNIWVATSKGVDRFADTPIDSLSVAEGLCGPNVSSVLASRDGSIWIGGIGTLTQLRNEGFTCFRQGRELPGGQVTALFEDHAGRLWLGLERNLWVYEGGRFRQVTRPDGGSIGGVSDIAEDVDQRMWIATFGPPHILMRVDGLLVKEYFGEPATPGARRLAADPTGGLWFGLFDGDLAQFRNGDTVVHRFEHPDGAQISQLLADVDGSVIAATSYGLVGWRDGKALTLTPKNGLPCEQVYGMAFDRRRDLWLYMNCALGVMTNADLQAWKQNPGMVVTMRTFDGLDGVMPVGASFSPGARSPDGRLWFANSNNLQVVDPEHVAGNTLPPPVYIEQVVADGKAYGTQGSLRLPPLSRDLQIDYVGLSFVAPQKVRFRYRLEGRDGTWQEPGTRRQAFYTDLRPGTYRFRVIASNNDGVWNEEGASVEIVIAPAWYQTRAFLMFITTLAGMAAWLGYRLRLRQVARALNARFNARLEERTRVARDLHDTLLQTVQGSKMVADSALDRPDDAPALARALQQVSAWLAQAGLEGRAAVNALRMSTTERNDLAEAFRRAVDDCRCQRAIEGGLTVTGAAKEMHPIVRDEIYRIGYEAIRNACLHSRGTRLDVGLDYGRDLTLRIADDGAGMDPGVADGGKEERFGLPGMRERAVRIGATLEITSAPGHGTAILVTVPGRVIFSDGSNRFIAKIRSVRSGRHKRWSSSKSSHQLHDDSVT